MMKEIPQSLPKKEWKKNYENNKTKYQERKRRPDAHATRRAESNGSQLEAVWACDWCTSWQAQRAQADKPQAKHYEVVKKGRVGPQANKLASERASKLDNGPRFG